VAILKVRLFGKFKAQGNGQELDSSLSTKAKELFCYLLLHRDRPHPREPLATLFWGECTPEQTRKYLRQTLWQLQTALHQFPGDKYLDVIRVEKGSVQLDTGRDLWLDVDEFEQSFVPVKGLPGEKMDATCASALRNAVSLYEGDLLGGWYHDWCLYHRERLENTYLAMLDKLMAYCELHDEFDAGFAYGERLLLQDRASERTYCRLMRMRYFAGDRAGALREFQRCEAALNEELGVAPAKQTVELREQICGDFINTQQSSAMKTPRTSLPAGNNPDSGRPLLIGLHKVRSMLIEIQRRLELDIQEVEDILNIEPSSSAKDKH
jgi:DNA-binding SARP family transcriptional activator